MKSSLFLTIATFFLLAPTGFAQNHAYVQMDFGGPVEYVVTDSQGKRSGLNPTTDTDYDEIPYAGYGDGSSGESREFGFNTALEDTSFSTTYTIQLFGTGNGVFKGSVGGRQTLSGKGASFSVLGVIGLNQTLTYVFNYSTDSTVTPTFTKVVTPQIIKQDFENCYRLGLLGKERLYRDFAHQLNEIVKDVARKDSLEARKDLERFGDKLEDVFKETFRDNPQKNAVILGEFEKTHKKFLDLDAYKILSEDISLILKELPEKHRRGDDHLRRDKI